MAVVVNPCGGRITGGGTTCHHAQIAMEARLLSMMLQVEGGSHDYTQAVIISSHDYTQLPVLVCNYHKSLINTYMYLSLV